MGGNLRFVISCIVALALCGPIVAAENQSAMVGGGPSWFAVHFQLPTPSMIFANLTTNANPEAGQYLVLFDPLRHPVAGGISASHPPIAGDVEINGSVGGTSIMQRLGTTPDRSAVFSVTFSGASSDYFLVAFDWGAVGRTTLDFHIDSAATILSAKQGTSVFAVRPDDPVASTGAGARLGSIGAAAGTGERSFHINGSLIGNFGSYNHGQVIPEGRTSLAGPLGSVDCPCAYAVPGSPDLAPAGNYVFRWIGFANGPVDNNDIAYWADVPFD